MLPLRDDFIIFRLLDVDNRLILPLDSQIRLLVRSSDVVRNVLREHARSMPLRATCSEELSVALQRR